jgi:hypothetical protein
VRIQFAVLRVIVFVVLARTCSFAEAQKIVKRVVIQSAAGGLEAGSNTLVTIRRRGSKYLLNGQPVSAVQVQSLVDALSAPPLTKMDMTNLGITHEWLASKAESQWPLAQPGEIIRTASHWPPAQARGIGTTAGQKKLFQESFTNLNLVANILPYIGLSIRLDYFAYCKVEIVFNHGSKLSAESYSYSSFMLPWSMKGRGFTYNADISRSIAALLPAESVNKSTLAGDELASELTFAVMNSIKREWNLLGSEDRAGDALKMLRTAYEVITAEITPYLIRPEYGTYLYFDALQEIDLHATIRRSNFPSNVTDTLVLRYADEKVKGVDEFLKSAAKYEDLVLSVPWLNGYIRDNPNAAVRISYVHDKSFSDKAMDVFAADMKLLGREDLIEQVKSQQAGIALLLINDTNTESHWLLFPDKHMMLWRYDGSSWLRHEGSPRLLKWTSEDFRKSGRECSDSLTLRPIICSGREITAGGMLASSTRR